MGILPEIERRLSAVVFKDDIVEREKLDVLIEAARWAPSCTNNQGWNFVFVEKSASTRDALEKGLTMNNAWAKKAPYLVAVGAIPEEACRTNGIPYYAYDCALSVMSFAIEAEHQGLRVHQMAGWDEGTVKEALGFPKEYRVVVVFALGYEGDPELMWNELDESARRKVRRERVRKPVAENFFYGSFGKD